MNNFSLDSSHHLLFEPPKNLGLDSRKNFTNDLNRRSSTVNMTGGGGGNQRRVLSPDHHDNSLASQIRILSEFNNNNSQLRNKG